MHQPFLIRRAKLKEVTGLSPSTVDRLEDAGRFPKRRRVGPGIVGWLSDEVQDFLRKAPQESVPTKVKADVTP